MSDKRKLSETSGPTDDRPFKRPSAHRTSIPRSELSQAPISAFQSAAAAIESHNLPRRATITPDDAQYDATGLFVWVIKYTFNSVNNPPDWWVVPTVYVNIDSAIAHVRSLQADDSPAGLAHHPVRVYRMDYGAERALMLGRMSLMEIPGEGRGVVVVLVQSVLQV